MSTNPDEWTVPNCQVCGKPIERWDRENHYIEYQPSVPAWEGGPLMTDPFAPVERIPDGYTFTAIDCGHVQDDHSKLVWIRREQGTGEGGSLMADWRKLAVQAENLKKAFFEAARTGFEPLVEYMAKIGRNDRP